MLRGIVRSLRAAGFRRLLIVNGHGGNIDPLAVSARELAHEFAMPVVATTPWFLAADEIAAIMETADAPMHACEGETSLMLAIAPDTVRTDRLDEAMRQAPPPVPARPGFSRFWSFSERAPVTGTRGDPRPSTAEKGKRFLEVMARALAEAMRDPVVLSKPDEIWAENRGQGTTAGGVPRV